MRRMTFLALGAALVVLLVACGGEEAPSDAGATAPETGGSAETPAPEAAPTATEEPTGDDEPTGATESTASPEADGAGAAAGAATVSLADSDLGEVLVDGEDRTLYLFMPDEQGPSTCYDGCAENWPPIVGEPTAGSGVDEALLGTVERDDGSMQVTYGGWPLYLFAGDSAPGDINGQGVGDVWYVMDAAGEQVQAPASGAEDAGAAATSTSAGGGEEEDY